MLVDLRRYTRNRLRRSLYQTQLEPFYGRPLLAAEVVGSFDWEVAIARKSSVSLIDGILDDM